MSLTAKAHAYYKNGDFQEAIAIYKKLGALLGDKLFSANIALCEKNISSQHQSRTSKTNTLNIAFIADDNFALPTYISIYSIIRNSNPNNKIAIYLLSVKISKSNIENIKNLQTENISISVIDIEEDNSQFEILKNGFHVSTAAIVKFNLPTILSGIDKLLYLDGDTIVCSDLSNLYDIPLDGLYAAVVQDIKPTLRYKPSILEKLSIKNHRHYFNSGMMLLNLDAMRKNNISEKLFQYRKNGINFFMDQDAFNVVLKDKVQYLSCKYNLLSTLPEEFSIDEISNEYKEYINAKSFKELENSAHIVHFASKQKPWKNNNEDRFSLWYRYYIASRAITFDSFPMPEGIKKANIENIVISLTSYPARIKTVTQTLESLLTQTFLPSSIILWLAKEEFPNGENSLPNKLLALKSKGILIKWYHNIKSYKKLIPTLKDHSDKIIVTVDDDIIYESTWLERLVASYIQYPDYIHCSRAHKIAITESGSIKPYKTWPREIKDSTPSFSTFFTGCGGVLYPPNCLHDNAVNEDEFFNLCTSGDDIWFWGMALLKETKIRVIPDTSFSLNFTENSQEIALWRTNDIGGQNDLMLQNLIRKYPEILEKIVSNSIRNDVPNTFSD